MVGGRGRPLHRGGGFFRRRGGCCSDHSTHVGGSAAWTLQAEFPAGLLTGKPGGETGTQGPLFGICCFTSFRLPTAHVTTRSMSRRVVPKPGGEARKPADQGEIRVPGRGGSAEVLEAGPRGSRSFDRVKLSPLQEGRVCPGAGLWRLYQVHLEERPPRHQTDVGFHHIPWLLSCRGHESQGCHPKCHAPVTEQQEGMSPHGSGGRTPATRGRVP